jgi:hypothetical protein
MLGGFALDRGYDLNPAAAGRGSTMPDPWLAERFIRSPPGARLNRIARRKD